LLNLEAAWSALNHAVYPQAVGEIWRGRKFIS